MIRLALFVALFAACGGSSRKPESTATVETKAEAQLELGELRLVDVKSNEAVLVHANGDIEIKGIKAVKVTPDGRMVNQEGEVGFTLQSDGTITGPDGKRLEITLSKDAVLKSGDKTITIDAAGALAGANPEAGEMKIEGADTPGKKRTALFVLVALTTTTAAGEASGGGGEK